MKMKLAALAAAALAVAAPAMADLVVPNLSYRTGPYAAGGVPYADGFQDYFTLLNERDGGIGGEKIQVPECETAYNTEKGVECYEATKGDGALVYNPLSTGITYQLIPKVTADGIPLYTPGYGRTSASNGKVFSNVFNYPGQLLGRRLGGDQVPADRERRRPEGQEDRAGLSQLGLRQGTDPHAGGAGQEARL